MRVDSPHNPVLAQGIRMLIICLHLRLSMNRLIARFLLLVALVGNFAPLALAAAAPPPHACCVRKAAHHCHDSVASQSDELVIRNSDCCSQDCRRAVTTARWAHAQPRAAAGFALNVEAYLGQSIPVSPDFKVFGFQSTRAPPHLSIA